MVEGEGGLQGDALDTGAPARLTPCPAGGAPQEGEGQPQQHGFWLESQGLLGRRGQAIQPQKGASPDLVGPSMAGGGPYLACGVLWSRPGAGSLVPGHPPLGPLYPPGPCGPPTGGTVKVPVGQEGAGEGSSWGNPQSHLGEGTCSLLPWPRGHHKQHVTLGAFYCHLWASHLDPAPDPDFSHGEVS